jgi:hypothetical protein
MTYSTSTISETLPGILVRDSSLFGSSRIVINFNSLLLEQGVSLPLKPSHSDWLHPSSIVSQLILTRPNRFTQPPSWTQQITNRNLHGDEYPFPMWKSENSIWPLRGRSTLTRRDPLCHWIGNSPNERPSRLWTTNKDGLRDDPRATFLFAPRRGDDDWLKALDSQMLN